MFTKWCIWLCGSMSRYYLVCSPDIICIHSHIYWKVQIHSQWSFRSVTNNVSLRFTRLGFQPNLIRWGSVCVWVCVCMWMFTYKTFLKACKTMFFVFTMAGGGHYELFRQGFSLTLTYRVVFVACCVSVCVCLRSCDFFESIYSQILMVYGPHGGIHWC